MRPFFNLGFCIIRSTVSSTATACREGTSAVAFRPGTAHIHLQLRTTSCLSLREPAGYLQSYRHGSHIHGYTLDKSGPGGFW